MNLEEEIDEIREKAVELRNESSFLLYNKAMYEFVRREKPELVAEAGVAGGATTYCILKAMEKNGKGRLYSFDPGHKHVDDEEHIGLEDAEYKKHEPGALIPSELKDRWNFYKMKFVEGEEILEKVVESEHNFDAFFHDSDHSDENINAEFEMMKNYVRKDGFFLIHDPPTDKVWDEFDLVMGNNVENEIKLTERVSGAMMRLGDNKYALKVFKRNESS